MFTTSHTSARIIAPLVLAGALMFTGCASSGAPASEVDTASGVEETSTVEVILGTGITSMDDVRYGSIDSDDPEFNAAIEELVLALNAASPGGLLEININAHGPDRVGINLLTDSEDGTVTAAQVTAIVDTLAGFTPPTPVREYILGGFNSNFGAGEILTAGADAGINPDFLDEMDQRIEIPGDQFDNLYA